MLSQFLTSIVDLSRRFALLLVAVALMATALMGSYVIGHIKINTDINQLLSDKLAWKARERNLDNAFPEKLDNIVIVIDGDTAEKANSAAERISHALLSMPSLFPYVSRPDALPFFKHEGLLFLSENELSDTLDQLVQAQPLIGTIATDPSLRGFFGTIDLMLRGSQSGSGNAIMIQRPLTSITATINAALSGEDLPLDWQSLMPSASSALSSHELRQFIITKPALDYSSLQPGHAAIDAIHKEVSDLGLSENSGVRVRLTGPVPLNDEEFATVANGTGWATALSSIVVLALLFLAMRSWRIVLPIALTLCVGLVSATFFATVAVGSLNLISVAFAVMFIGIAVDFGIQFGIRYRDQRHKQSDHTKALASTAKIIAAPLSMAAASTALGFLAFIPTDYRGVSELGLIAGVGMIIAFALNISLLPALMTLTKPSAEREAVGFSFLAAANEFLVTRRARIIPIIALAALGSLIFAARVNFDFDPLDLKDKDSVSVSTMLDVMRDPDSDAYAAQLLVPSAQDAREAVSKLEKLPQVDHVMTLESFVPSEQKKKLSMIADTGSLLAPTFALPVRKAPNEAENIAAIEKTASTLHQVGAALPAAKDLAESLDRLRRAANPELLARVQHDIIDPMQSKMQEIGGALQTRPVALSDLPPELKKDWVSSDGRWLVEIYPKRGADNNPRDAKLLTSFITSVQEAEPDAAGTPVSIRESGRTIISAFIHAGIYGLGSIALLSLIALRRLRDVLIMLTPLVVAAIFTLATIGVLGIQLNFANIIALPLLLSLGVSYAVYFVFYSKTGRSDFLQSSMARAVLFSAATVLVAFSSLCFSAHPGTRGMGVLLTISLIYSLLCTFLMLPVLLGAERSDTPKEIDDSPE